MKVFFDTSAIAKRYIREDGTDAVLAWCEKADAIGLAVICPPELISAFCRLVREGKLSGQQYAELKAAMLQDIADMDIGEITPLVVRQPYLPGAISLARHGRHSPRLRPGLSAGYFLVCGWTATGGCRASGAGRQRDLTDRPGRRP